MEHDYEALLRRARSQLPEVSSGWERLEVPTLQYSVVGMRTTIHNLREIAEALNREPQHLLKFLSGELATAATLQESRAIFQGKFPRETLERLIQRYIETFVVCPVCKRLLSICDSEILGKTLRDGKIVFRVSEEFYKGEEVEIEEAIAMIENSTIVNMIGVRVVKRAVERGYVHPEAILKIEGIPHAQIIKL